VRALDGVDLEVQPGEMVAIRARRARARARCCTSPGRSTRLPPASSRSAGGATDDCELTRLRRDSIGFVFQFFNLLPSLSAAENVLLPALIAGRADDVARERARELLVRVGLGDRADHRPAELSDGQQQRVSIARALLMAPRIVLADEPTGNLDTGAGREILALLRHMCDEDGLTIVMVTHDPSAAAIADRVVLLRDGRGAGEAPGGSTERVLEFLATLEPDAIPV
jgi:putative ABC transport system ATP-binding protein